MAALTAGRAIPERTGNTVPGGLAASTKIYQGALACLSGNYVVNGATATGLKALGIAIDEYDNSTGVDGAVVGEFRRGVFRFNNSTSGDAIAKGDIGSNCYIVDNQTVAKTDGTGTRSVAGKISDVDAQGVWVDLR